jgi:type I restriction enzyme S subunit
VTLDEPWPLRNGWRWSTIGDLTSHLSGEWGADPGASDVDVPVVRSTDTRAEVVEIEGAEIRSLTRNKLEKTALHDNDILVVKSSGSAHLVGRPSLVAALDGREVGFSNFMLRLRAKDGVSPQLLFGFLASPAGRALFLRLNRTTSGLRNLLLDRYLRVPVPVPETPEAGRSLTNQLERVEEAMREAEATHTRLGELRLSLLLDAIGAPRADESRPEREL